ncbi:MAG: hypothetical protein CSA50_02430, partial [Gammaproteobacteria bacterium]
QTVDITVTVNPKADAPTMGADIAVTINEDESATGWVLPTVKDQTDANDGDAGDWPERLGLLEFSGLPEGARVEAPNGTVYTVTNSGKIEIKITDKPGYHTTEAQSSSADIELTEADFQQLKIYPPENSSKDMAFTLSATEYEVNENGDIITAAGSKTSTQNITVEVNPVTDGDFTLAATPIPAGNEDAAINLQNYITLTEDGDTDGSEHYVLAFSSTESLDHVRFRFEDSGPWQTLDQFNAAKHDFHGDGDGGSQSLPKVYIKTLDHDSRDIKGLTLTLTAQDHDEDNPDAIGEAAVTGTSRSVNLGTIAITPIANDISLKPGGASGDEDTRINMGLDFTNNDGPIGATHQEVVDHLVVNNIPAGVKIYKADGTELTDGTQTSYDTATHSLSEADIKGLTILPTQDFSGTIDLDVTVYAKDFDDDTPGANPVIVEQPPKTHTITVKGVVDTSEHSGSQWDEGESELADNGHLAVKIMLDVTGDPAVETALAAVDEDTAVDVGMSWKSYENVDHSTTDNSETAEFIITNQAGDTTSFTVVNAAGDALGTKVSGGWKLTKEELEQAHIKAQKDFAGDIRLQLQTTVTDGEDSNTQIDRFKVSFTPVTDEPKLQLTDLYIQEDTKSQFDIFPQTTDVDGSEQVTRVELSNIPDGVTFYIKNADGSFTAVDYGSDHSHTFIIDDSGATPGSVTADQLKNLHIQAPPESNKDFTVTVTPTVKDPGSSNSATTTADIKVYVKGDADTPLAKHPDIDKIEGSEPQTGEDGLIDISSLIGKSGETVSGQAAADDSSETLSYILQDLPKEFAPTDAAGNITGDFITASDGKVTWSFTHEQMKDLHIKVPT